MLRFSIVRSDPFITNARQCKTHSLAKVTYQFHIFPKKILKLFWRWLSWISIVWPLNELLSQCWSSLWKMHLRSPHIKMTEKTGSSSMFETPNSSPSYNNQQDEDPVSHLIQRMQKLEAIISKLWNINLDSLEFTNFECSLPNLSTRMLTLEKMVHYRVQPSQFNEKEQSCDKLANPPHSNK